MFSKKLFVGIFIILFLAACGQATPKQSQELSPEERVKNSVEKFLDTPYEEPDDNGNSERPEKKTIEGNLFNPMEIRVGDRVAGWELTSIEPGLFSDRPGKENEKAVIFEGQTSITGTLYSQAGGSDFCLTIDKTQAGKLPSFNGREIPCLEGEALESLTEADTGNQVTVQVDLIRFNTSDALEVDSRVHVTSITKN